MAARVNRRCRVCTHLVRRDRPHPPEECAQLIADDAHDAQQQREMNSELGVIGPRQLPLYDAAFAGPSDVPGAEARRARAHRDKKDRERGLAG